MYALTDVCVLGRMSDHHDPPCAGDKRYLGHGDLEPQLFAQAVAAFQFHNRQLCFAGPSLIARSGRPLI